jgi:hypothetical protein
VCPGFETFPCSHSLMRDGEVEILAEGRPCAKVRGDGFLAGEIRGEPRLAVVFSTQVQMWPPSCGRIVDSTLGVFVFKIDCVPRVNRFARALYPAAWCKGSLRARRRYRSWGSRRSAPARGMVTSHTVYLAVHHRDATAKRNPEQQGRPHRLFLLPQTLHPVLAVAD